MNATLPTQQREQGVSGGRAWALTPSGDLRIFWKSAAIEVAVKLIAAAAGVGLGFFARLAMERSLNAAELWRAGAIIIALALTFVFEIFRRRAGEAKQTAIENERDELKKQAELTPGRIEAAQIKGASDISRHASVVLRDFVPLATADQPERQSSSYARSTLSQLCKMLNNPDARATLYRYQATDDAGQAKPSLAYMACSEEIKLPRTGFDSETEHGLAVIGLVQNQGDILVEDVKQSNSFPVDPNIEGYETFIGVAVAWAGQEYGYLTVDCPRSGDLTETHKYTVHLCAKYLAASLDIIETRSIPMDQSAHGVMELLNDDDFWQEAGPWEDVSWQDYDGST